MDNLTFDNREIAPEYKVQRSSLAMTISLVSFAMLFATLMLGYAIFRFQNSVWPPMGFERVSLLQPLLSTLFISLSSLSLWQSQLAFRQLKHDRFKKGYYCTLFLGFAFLASQFLLWNQMNIAGIKVDTGIFASILHGFTWIHAAHMLLGILGLFYLMPLVWSCERFKNSLTRVENIAKFWHFLGIVWALMLLSLFII